MLRLLWCSVTKSCPNSLPLHELQHTRFPCPLLSPWVCSNSYPLSQWCHPIILSSIAPFSFSPQSSPALGSFLMCRLFTSGGQTAEASAAASVPPMNIQDWFPLGLTGLISMLSKELSGVFSSTTVPIIFSRFFPPSPLNCFFNGIKPS